MSKSHLLQGSSHQKITQMMLDLITAKNLLPWKQSWTGDWAPINWATKQPYTGVNAMFLSFVRLVKNYSSPYWVAYMQLNKLGGRVEKGAKGTPILVPAFWVPRSSESPSPPSLSVPVIEETGLLSHFIVRHVFNLDQCAIPERYNPRFPTKKAFNPVKKAEEILASYHKPPALQPSEEGAFYFPTTDSIGMPPRHQFTSPEEYYNTLFHELIHSTGHKSRLKRALAGHYHKAAYSREELIAEFGASFLASEAGFLQQVQTNNAAYLRGWVSYLRDHEEELLEAALLGSRAANFILQKRKRKREEMKGK